MAWLPLSTVVVDQCYGFTALNRLIANIGDLITQINIRHFTKSIHGERCPGAIACGSLQGAAAAVLVPLLGPVLHNVESVTRNAAGDHTVTLNANLPPYATAIAFVGTLAVSTGLNVIATASVENNRSVRLRTYDSAGGLVDIAATAYIGFMIFAQGSAQHAT